MRTTSCLPAAARHGWPLVGVLIMAGTGRALDPEVTVTPLPPPPHEASDTLFLRVPLQTSGITMVNRILPNHERDYLFHSGFACGGVSIGDVTGDGLPDVFLASGPDANRLYVNRGNWQFVDQTDAAGVGGGEAWGTGPSMVDIDGDGDLDIYLCNYVDPNQLFINDGTGRFTEDAAGRGLAIRDACLFPAFADYDLDGDLDVYVLNNRWYRPEGRPETPPIDIVEGRPVVKPEFAKYYGLLQSGQENYMMDTIGRSDRLLRNDGDGTFTDVSTQAGLSEGGHGLSVTWWDYDRDGDLDIYAANDFSDPDLLYRNNGDGTFTDVIAHTMPQIPWSAMGSDTADFNNDGWLDYFCADMAATTHVKAKINMGPMEGPLRLVLENGWPRQAMRNHLFVNTGYHWFTETAFMSGLAQSDWTWAVKAADFDNDGWVDLFVANGNSRNFTEADARVGGKERFVGRTPWDDFRDRLPMPEENLAFRNEGGLRFTQVADVWGVYERSMSYGAATGDLDRDGDLDLVVCNLDAPPFVYENRSLDGNRCIVELVGRGPNRAGIGARVDLRTDNLELVRQMNPMTGFASCNEPVLHFGLGEATRILELRVSWPGGPLQVLRDLPVNHRLVVTIPETGEPVRPEPPSRTRFINFTGPSQIGFLHRERPFDDYARQPLLPGRLSQLGGGIAVGDVDGDGDEDVFAGNGAGAPGALLLNDGTGRYAAAGGGPWEADAEAEDMGVLWFDAEADGDPDLLVVSGGIEAEPGAAVYGDRLYLNDGQGRFTVAPPDVFPPGDQSGSAAVAADWDQDGDLDVFIGARSIPGHYPETPESRLLRNDEGRFVDVTDEGAPGLRKAGLVTGALWSDVENDGDVDLLVAVEWGPIRLFRNERGRLVEATESAGLDRYSGWWNSITGADVDQDGDIDYLVGNVGLNTKYGTAKPDKPAVLFSGDMDGSGKVCLVEAKPGKGDLLPVRGLSCSSSAIPHLKAKFPTYRSFAYAGLSEIYTPECLANALRLEATQFESGIWLNDGDGHFTWRAMPFEVQASPGFGLVATEWDGDGGAEWIVVQNLFSREPETGLWRGGVSALVHQEADGTCRVEPTRQSGLLIRGDAKGASYTDANGDGWPDLVVQQNNDRLFLFRNRGKNQAPLAVRLRGPQGNLTGIGARIEVRAADQGLQAYEVYGGSGYLSQSSPVIYLPPPNPGATLQVRWPDGSVSRAIELDPSQPVTVSYGDGVVSDRSRTE